MQKLVEQHKTILINCSCPVFPLANLTVKLVGTNIEKCDIQFVTATFAVPYLRDKK